MYAGRGWHAGPVRRSGVQRRGVAAGRAVIAAQTGVVRVVEWPGPPVVAAQPAGQVELAALVPDE